MKANTALIEGRHFTIQPNGCWVWRLKCATSGYAHIHVYGRTWRAHRWAYTLAKGPIPDGMLVCHSCDNPACVNPAHLWLGTQLANRRDAVRKHRQAKGEGCGRSKLTEDRVREIRQLLAGHRTQQFIADTMGVSREAINGIANGRNWKSFDLTETP